MTPFDELQADLENFPIEGYFNSEPLSTAWNYGGNGGAVWASLPLISHITDNLYVGGYEEPGGLANNMKRLGDDYMGFGHNLGDFFSDIFSLFVWGKYITGPDTETHGMVMYDSSTLPMDREGIEYFSDLVVEKLKAGGNVLVHCQAGINRSNLIAGRALMKWKGMGADEAVRLLRERRSDLVLSNEKFVTHLRKFDPRYGRNGKWRKW